MTKNLYEKPFTKPLIGRHEPAEIFGHSTNNGKPGLVEPIFKPVAKDSSVSNSGQGYYHSLPEASYQEFAPQGLATTLAASVMPKEILNAVADGKDFTYYAPYLIFTINWVNRVARIKNKISGFFGGIKQRFQMATMRMKMRFEGFRVRKWHKTYKKDLVSSTWASGWAEEQKVWKHREAVNRSIKCCDQYGLFSFSKNEDTFKTLESFFDAIGAGSYGRNGYQEYAEKLSCLPEPLLAKLPKLPAIVEEEDKAKVEDPYGFAPFAYPTKKPKVNYEELAEMFKSLNELLENSLESFYNHFENEKKLLAGSGSYQTKELVDLPEIKYLPTKICSGYHTLLCRKASEAEGNKWGGNTANFLKNNPDFRRDYYIEAQKSWQQDVINFFKNSE